MRTLLVATIALSVAAITTASASLVPTMGDLSKTDLQRAREHLQKVGRSAMQPVLSSANVGSTKAAKRKWAAELAAAFKDIEQRHLSRRVEGAKGVGAGNGCDYCSSDSTCCSDTCCQNGQGVNKEECCPDPVNGGVCCITQQTKCCKPNPARDLPSHCCPNWYVCCEGGRYGCCDPDTMLPMESSEFYTILQEEDLWGNVNLFGASVDSANATVGNKIKLPHTYHTNGEIPRSFMFSKKTGNFYILQANATENAAPGPNPDRPIHLFEVNPRTGSIKKTKVAGAMDQVTGFHYVDELEKIVISTPIYNTSVATGKPDQRIGFNFYHVDPQTGAATLVSKYDSTENEGYSGWFHEVSPNGLIIYRLGYQHPTDSINFGVETTNITTMAASSMFTVVRSPLEYTHFRTMNKLPGKPTKLNNVVGAADDGPYFVSIASSVNTTNFGDMAVFIWSLANPDNSIVKVGSFANAHRTPYFGPIQEAISPDGTTYAAFVSQSSPLGTQWDTWAFGMVDLSTGATTETTVSPTMLSAAESIAGLGITGDSQLWKRKI